MSDLNTRLAEFGLSPAMLEARSLRVCDEAADLVLVEVGADGRQHRLVPAAAEAWRSLKAAAAEDGVELFIVSAFRSVDRQAEIVRGKLGAGMDLEAVFALCAPPGYSEHHTGRAIDVSTPGSPALEVEFDRTDAYAWLERHAAAFGYRLSYPIGNPFGFQYEPWHWRFHDVAGVNTMQA